MKRLVPFSFVSDFDRVQYQLLNRIIRKGGMLYTYSLDRFG